MLEQKANKIVLNTKRSLCNKLKIHIIATRHEYGAIPCLKPKQLHILLCSLSGQTERANSEA